MSGTSPAVETAEPAAFHAPHQLTSRDVFLLLGRLWPFIRPYRRHLVYLFLLLIPWLPSPLIARELVRIVFDTIGHGKPLTPLESRMLGVAIDAPRQLVLWRLCVTTGIGAVIITPYALGSVGYGIWILQRVTNRFRVDLYSRLQEMSLRFHSEEKIGDAIFRMFQDSAAAPAVIDSMVIQPLRLLPVMLFSLVALCFLNLPMALIAFAVLPADVALVWYYSKRLRRAFVGEREATALATTRIEETLSSIRAVKAFGSETIEYDQYSRDNWNAFLASREARLMLVRFGVWSNITRGFAVVAVLLCGALQVKHGVTAGYLAAPVTLGVFTGNLQVFDRINNSSRGLLGLWANLQDVVVAIARVLEMLQKPVEEQVASGAEFPPAHAESVVFDAVGFGYDPRTPVLCDVSFEVHAGEIVALAGASGSGKSTIIGLLLRFFDPIHGEIRLDGTPLRQFELSAWRAMLSTALQDSPVFTATLRDNVAYGRANATDEEILEALARAGLAEFLRAQPQGLATMLGEKGSKISTGQAQRIALARALLRDAPILLLDEPTSALDGATEEAVMGGIRDWLNDGRGRMAIIATHRGSTAARCDRSYRLASGRVEAVDAPEFDTLAAQKA
ncbi:MAG TPA: ABC transporter ATP-binding protein [Candidatus Binataceae bacterium]|nr:ABC transporter ATP-binding protein [Candidatus Binataceae bacterium]